uniref:Helicase n=1 Tax=Macrostomum lignano TaxID=282301 RepID=A0A1I8GLK6_9PLAT
GNQENRATVYDNKIIDYINFILRSSDFEGCSVAQIAQLRQSIANLVISLIEENSPEAIIIAREVKDTLDKGALYRVMAECYEMQLNDGKEGGGLLRRILAKEDRKELMETVFDVGFSFYVILARLYDIDPLMGKKELRITDVQQKAFKLFKKNSMTIEINVLRDEVKEKLKWNVDRNSSSTKIRDFMDWTKAILNDIHYQKKVLSNP